LLEEHRTDHNEVRPHSSHDYETPNAFFETRIRVSRPAGRPD